MSLETQRKLLETRLRDFMTANHPSIPVAYTNAPFEQPDGPFVAIRIKEAGAVRANLGPNFVVRLEGDLEITVYQPENTGSALANTVANGIGRHFQERDHQLEDGARLTLRAASYPPAADRRGFAGVGVKVPYFRDERHAPEG